jgi:hypothetical protein
LLTAGCEIPITRDASPTPHVEMTVRSASSCASVSRGVTDGAFIANGYIFRLFKNEGYTAEMEGPSTFRLLKPPSGDHAGIDYGTSSSFSNAASFRGQEICSATNDHLGVGSTMVDLGANAAKLARQQLGEL